MRILQVHTRYRYEGGEDAVARAEATLLAEAGHEVVPFIAENPSRPGPTAAAMLTSAWNPLAARTLRAVATRVRPDVAHVHNTWFALSPSVVRELDLAGIPVVVTLHNYRLLCVNASLFRDGRPCLDCVGHSPLPGVVHRCYRDSAVASAAVAGCISANRALGTWTRHAGLFLALNDYARDRFIEGGLPADRIRVKPNVVPDPGQRVAPPSASGTVLFVGRLDPLKGLGMLLDAWAAASPPGLELVIVGDGPQRAELEARNVPGVTLAGRRTPAEVRAMMLEARTLVFPTLLLEGPSLVVREAFAAGLPVLASGLGGIPELVGQLGPRWLVPASTPAAWAAALAGLPGGDELDEAGRGARALWAERLTPEAGLRALEEAYTTVLPAGADR